MKYDELIRGNKIELQIYQFFGVDKFQKVILWLERIKHYKDKGKNENYHLCSLNVISLEKYNGFLLYNAFMHCVSMLFIFTYFSITIAYGICNKVCDVIMIIFLILDVYCILLQRMNYLRANSYCYKHYQKYKTKANLLKEKISRIICLEEPQVIYNDYKLICSMRDAYLGKADCYLKGADIESMNRICKYVECYLPQNSTPKRRVETEIRLIDNCNLALGPYTVLQLKVDSLQKWFRTRGRKTLAYTSIITENAECEALYKRMIPKDTLANICIVCCVLYEIYTDIIDGMKKVEMQI